MDTVTKVRDCSRKTAEDCLYNKRGGCMGHTPAMLLRILFGMVALVASIGLSSLSAVAQPPSRPELHCDLQSIVDAKVLRVAVTRFDLPSFHVRGRDRTLLGPEIEMAQQIARALGSVRDNRAENLRITGESKQPFRFQLSDDAVIDQILGFETAESFIRESQHADAVADTIYARINPPRIHSAHEIVALQSVIRLRQAQPLRQAL